MTKTNLNSELCVWSGGYISNIEERKEEDHCVEILQIEKGSSEGFYIVEVLHKEKIDWEDSMRELGVAIRHER